MSAFSLLPPSLPQRYKCRVVGGTEGLSSLISAAAYPTAIPRQYRDALFDEEDGEITEAREGASTVKHAPIENNHRSIKIKRHQLFTNWNVVISRVGERACV